MLAQTYSIVSANLKKVSDIETVASIFLVKVQKIQVSYQAL